MLVHLCHLRSTMASPPRILVHTIFSQRDPDQRMRFALLHAPLRDHSRGVWQHVDPSHPTLAWVCFSNDRQHGIPSISGRTVVSASPPRSSTHRSSFHQHTASFPQPTVGFLALRSAIVAVRTSNLCSRMVRVSGIRRVMCLA